MFYSEAIERAALPGFLAKSVQMLACRLGHFMTVPILICECGLRLKAPGATPGRVGRCPSCGGKLRVPVTPASRQPRPATPGEDPGAGYRLQAASEASTLTPNRVRPTPDEPAGGVFVERKRPASTGDGLLPVLAEPETTLLASIPHPLRGAESIGMVVATSVIFWIFTILVPEYCLTLMADADSMGVPILGHFIAVITVLPYVILFPLVILYWLQYLGRVIVASAMGETHPPRTPDRNFAGFFHGISPWLIWLILGVTVGAFPLGYYGSSLSSWSDANIPIVITLLLLGLPYVLMALMLTFLHDSPVATTPWSVVGSIFRLGASFGLLTLFVAAVLVIAGATAGVALLLRARVFWLYIFSALGCWIIVQWTTIVVMRVLGNCYYQHRNTLRWHRESPRWGVAWRL